jgi:hypothetical protein
MWLTSTYWITFAPATISDNPSSGFVCSEEGIVSGLEEADEAV